MSDSVEWPYMGTCLCGEIQYEVKQVEAQLGHCHCTMCRKFHGAAFATLGEAYVENFRWVAGEELLKTYEAPNGTKRKFCDTCGSSLIFVASNDDGKLVEFSLGTLDTGDDLQPDAHIFTNYGACWYKIRDDLPQYGEGRRSTSTTS